MLTNIYGCLSSFAKQQARNTYVEIPNVLPPKSDFNVRWQKFLLIGITIISLHEQMVKVCPFHWQCIIWVFLSLNNQTKQKHNTEEVIVPSLIWLAASSVKYENKKPTQTIIPA